MLKNRTTTILLLIILINLAGAAQGLASDLIIEPVSLLIIPDYYTWFDPETLLLEIALKPGANSVNAIFIDLAFSPDKLAIEAISYELPFCDLIPYKSIDNTRGRLQLICGTATPPVSDSISVAIIKFAKLDGGWAKVSFGEATRALTSDGQGTSLPIQTEIHKINIIK